MQAGKYSSHPVRLFWISGLKNRWLDGKSICLVYLHCFVSCSSPTLFPKRQTQSSQNEKRSFSTLAFRSILISFTSSSMTDKRHVLLFFFFQPSMASFSFDPREKCNPLRTLTILQNTPCGSGSAHTAASGTVSSPPPTLAHLTRYSQTSNKPAHILVPRKLMELNAKVSAMSMVNDRWAA